MNRSLTLIAVMVLVLSESRARSQESVVEDYSSGPFCGQYVVYAALRSVGRVPDETFVGDRNYLHGDYGSTADDLVKAIQHFGCHAVERKQMSLQSLMLISKPVILHTRNVSSLTYTHWMLFLGWNGDKVIVYDPPRHVLHLSPGELLALWSGYGIVVSEAPLTALDYCFLWLPNWKSLLILSILIVAACSLRTVRRGSMWTLLLCAIAVCATALLPPSPLTDYQYVHLSVPAREHEVPTVTLDELPSISASRPTILIDARHSAAYVQGHIPGAISLPIDSTYGDYIYFLTERASKASTCVIYCQSEHCVWARDVAARLHQLGRDDACVLPGGMEAFLEAGGRPERSVFNADRYR